MISLLTCLTCLTFSSDLTKEDVKTLVAAGVSDDVIVLYIQKHGPISPPLTSDDLIDLRNSKVSEKVLSALLASTEDKVAAPPRLLPPRETYPYASTDPDSYFDYYVYPYYWGFGGTLWLRTGYPYDHHRHPYGYFHEGYPWAHGGYGSYSSPSHPHGIQPQGSSTPRGGPRGHR